MRKEYKISKTLAGRATIFSILYSTHILLGIISWLLQLAFMLLMIALLVDSMIWHDYLIELGIDDERDDKNVYITFQRTKKQKHGKSS